MGILKDIKQTVEFADKRDEVIVNIRFTNNYINMKCNPMYKQHDITHQQYNILRILKGSKESLSSAQIKNRMIEQKSDVSRLIDRLVTKELITKTSCHKDQRKVDISITESGLSTIHQFDKHTSEKVKQCINLSVAEMTELSRLLDKLRRSEDQDH